MVGCALYRVSGACFTRMARGNLRAGVRLWYSKAREEACGGGGCKRTMRPLRCTWRSVEAKKSPPASLL